MNRSPLLMIILAGLLVLCLLAAVAFIRSGQIQATTETGEPGGELGQEIPFTGQSGQTETPDGEQTPAADQTPAGGETPTQGADEQRTQPGVQGTPAEQATATERPTLRPSRTPGPTNTPIPTFTRMPTRRAATATQAGPADGSPTAGGPQAAQAATPGAAPTAVDDQTYRTAVTRQLQGCNESLATFDEFARAVTTDPTTLFAPNIRTRLDENLEEIEGTCGFLGTIDPVPSGYTVADQTLDRAAAEYNEMTDAFTRGVDSLNPALLIEALDHLEAATALANQAQQQMP